jgi:HSP20 family protein
MEMPGFSDTFSAILALQRALESSLGSDWMGGGTAGTGAYPPINIFKQGDDFVAVIELPGIDKGDLAIEAKENTIRISGKRALKHEDNVSIHRRERLSGVFDRTISYLCRSRQMASAPNIMTDCWRCSSPARKARSRAQYRLGNEGRAQWLNRSFRFSISGKSRKSRKARSPRGFSYP